MIDSSFADTSQGEDATRGAPMVGAPLVVRGAGRQPVIVFSAASYVFATSGGRMFDTRTSTGPLR